MSDFSVLFPESALSKSGGSEVAIENGNATINAVDYPIVSLNLYGNSVQDGTPTPNSPIDIVDVGDDGSINILSCGDTNFFEGQQLEYGTWNEYGLPVETTAAIKTTKRTYLEAGTYIISTQNAKRGVGYKYSSATADTGIRIFDWGDNNIPQIFTLTESAYCAFAFNNVPGTGDIKLEDVTDLKMQVCSAATITSGLPLCSVGDVRDELIYNADGTGKIIKRTAKLDSYNGETITTDYISSTGGLDTGAEVVYVLENPIEIELSATEKAEFMQLQTFDGITYIYNDEGAKMSVKIATNPLLAEYVAPILKGLMTNSAAMSAFLGV